MRDLSQERCLNHPGREAAALCPECRQFYCRECVTEHDDRALCAGCLRKLADTETQPRRRLAWLRCAAACMTGWLLAALFFYFMGRELVALPSSFHEGTIWKVPFSGEP
jgi:hypothetical protein